MTEPFTPDDIARLSAEIDRELLALGTPGTSLARATRPSRLSLKHSGGRWSKLPGRTPCAS
jgi:hypothetical protein